MRSFRTLGANLGCRGFLPSLISSPPKRGCERVQDPAASRILFRPSGLHLGAGVQKAVERDLKQVEGIDLPFFGLPCAPGPTAAVETARESRSPSLPPREGSARLQVKALTSPKEAPVSPVAGRKVGAKNGDKRCWRGFPRGSGNP